MTKIKAKTVGEFIEILNEYDKDAYICNTIFNDYEFGDVEYSSIELINYHKNIEFIDDLGNTVVGDVISIY